MEQGALVAVSHLLRFIELNAFHIYVGKTTEAQKKLQVTGLGHIAG